MNPDSFLQSPEWEAVQHSAGRAVLRVGGVLVIRHDLPAGLHYIYTPRPALGITNQESGIGILDSIRTIAKRQGSVFLKIDPARELPRLQHQAYPASAIQPPKTTLLDLDKSPDDLLSSLGEKTRYNMRLAERKGVCIVNQESGNTGHGFETFWRLIQGTARRDRFRTHPRGYYEKLLGVRSPDFSNEIFFAEYRGVPIAAALVNFYRPSRAATYLHGASSSEYRSVMGPHLLHWHIAIEARRRGCAGYDLYGIDEKRWPGVTRFKMGFGGRVIEYPPSVDIVYRPAYYGLYLTGMGIKRALYGISA